MLVIKTIYRLHQSTEQLYKEVDGDYFHFNSPRGGGGAGGFTQAGSLCIGGNERSSFPHPQSSVAQCFIPVRQKKVDPKFLEHCNSIIEILKILKDADLHQNAKISSEDIANNSKNAGGAVKKVEDTVLIAQKIEKITKQTFNGIKYAENKLGNAAHSVSDSGIAKRIRSKSKELSSNLSLPYAVRKKIENVLQRTQKSFLAIETVARIDTFYADRSVQNYLEMSESLLKWTPAGKPMEIEKKVMECFLPGILDWYLKSHDLPSVEVNAYAEKLADWYVDSFYRPPRDHTREVESLNKFLNDYEEELNKERNSLSKDNTD